MSEYDLNAHELAVSRQYRKLLEAKEAADKLWLKVDRETQKLVRLAKIGRKYSITVRLTETHGLEISNQFKGKDKVFAPAFARKWKVTEVRIT